MKKTYSTPSVRFKSIRLNENISDICWAYAAGHVGEKLYWDADPTKSGYVSFAFNTKSNCDSATESYITVYTWLNDITSQSAARARIITLPGGNSAEPFKGSPFSKTPPS